MMQSGPAAAAQLGTPRGSIRRRLLWASAILIAAALSVCAGSLYVVIYRPLVNDLATADMRRAAATVSGDVAAIFSRVEGIARTEQAWGTQGIIDVDRVDATNELLYPVLAGTSRITSSAIARDTGREILITFLPEGGFFNRLSDPDAWGHKARFVTHGAHGEVLSEEQKDVDYDARTRPWFQAVMGMASDNGIYWTPPFTFVSTGEVGISAVVRWKAPDGHRYAMTDDIRLADLTNFTQRVSVGKSGLAALLTDDGLMLGLPRDPRFGSAATVKDGALKPVDAIGVAPLTAACETWRQRGRPDGEIIRFDVGGNAWLAAFQAIRPAGQTYWIATLAPVGDFGALPENTLAMGVLLFIGTMAIASLAAVWLSRRLSRPIEQLSAESERIGRMELEQPIQTNSSVDEIVALARSLEEMRLNLISAQRNLESKAELERQLAHSRRMDAIGKLTGGVAHDFNNLLAVISGNLELLTEEPGLSPELRKMTEDALHSAKRGATLTRSLLSFARQQDLVSEAIDLDRLIGEIVELIRRTVPADISVEWMRRDRLWYCEADAGQLQNALLNLIVNARDAMPNGGRLTIEADNVTLSEDYAATEPEVKPGEYVRLTVSDTGVGMSPEVLAHAYEPFFTTKGVGVGTGLGLSMVYGFAKQSKGHVKIYSEEGVGTSVKMYLPRAAAITRDYAPSASTSIPARGNEMVLIVEDDPKVLDLTVALVRSLGYGTKQARSGPAAIEALQAHASIKLVLSDVILPGGMNGAQMADRLLTARPDLRVVIMSGYTENAMRDDLRLARGVHFLAKPFTKAELAAALRAALD